MLIFMLFGRRLEYGLVDDPGDVNDEDLKSTMELRQLQPYSGMGTSQGKSDHVTRNRI